MIAKTDQASVKYPMPSCFALIKANEKKYLELFTLLWYNRINMQANTLRGGLVYEYSTYEIRGRSCKTRFAE